ncbi:MAG: DEAD/DEAH box helicase [Victivallales bacterium]|nr:DEAD/DEAH box helicase [Victivallales bacterium]
MSNFITRFFKKLFGGASQEVEQEPPAQETVQEEAVYLPSEGKRRRNDYEGSPLTRSKENRRDRNSQKPQRPEREKNVAAKPPQNNAPKPPKPSKPKRDNAPKPPTEKESSGKGIEREKRRELPSMEGWEIPAGERRSADEVLFQDFALDARILRAVLEEMGFRACSPIQAKALPHTLKGEDLAGRAQTGTGKTAAFLITILQHYLVTRDSDDRDPWQPFAMILAPTRELAIQIANDAENIAAFCPEFKIVAVYGGMDFDKQMTSLSQGVDLVVATPGRLIDYLHRHAVNLSKVSIAVIDEADRMLDMGFIPDVKRIFGYLSEPEKRQTMLFSATLTKEIMQLAAQWMRPNPTIVEIEPEHVLAEGIEETTYAATTDQKVPIILWTLAHEDCRRVLIFRNRKRDVEALANLLKSCGISCEMLSGDVEQKKRLRILEDFRTGRTRIVVATDVAGRGIHVDDVTHVINYDFPYEAEDYVHRVGRTARAGHKGRAINFADEDSSFVIPEIETFIERPLPITHPEDELLEVPPTLKQALARGQFHESHNHSGAFANRGGFSNPSSGNRGGFGGRGGFGNRRHGPRR